MTIHTGAIVEFQWNRKGKVVTLKGKVEGIYEDDYLGTAYTVRVYNKHYYVKRIERVL